ncbi:unnamed protein product [Cunninghamella echinulata]
MRQPIKKDINETIKTETSAQESSQPIVGGGENTIELTIKILKPSSQFRITRLGLDDTILTLKQRIYQQQTIPVKQQRLLLKGKVLNDDKSLNDYNMTKDTILHLMVSKPPASTAASSSVPEPMDTTPVTTSTPNELSTHAQTTLKSDTFWNAIEEVLRQHQLDTNDTQLILGKWKKD